MAIQTSMNTTKVRLWIVNRAEKSIVFSRLPKDKHGPGNDFVCVGRSIIEHLSCDPLKVNEWQHCIATLPDWLVEKENL